jgi:hypothetical protein
MTLSGALESRSHRLQASWEGAMATGLGLRLPAEDIQGRTFDFRVASICPSFVFVFALSASTLRFLRQVTAGELLPE